MKEEEIFDCACCGFCCHGETTVSLDALDLQRMVAFLGIGEDQVREKYLRVTGRVIQMKVVDGHCIFFDQGCTIHPGKPWRCSQWPLHPSILSDRANFETIRESCPGINRELTYEVFAEKLSCLLAKE